MSEGRVALRWIAANAVGEIVAYGAVAAAGAALTPRVAGAAPAAEWVVGVGMLTMGVLEGAILGALQWRAIGGSPRCPGGRYVGATTAAMTLAWALGLAASYLEPPEAPGLALLAVQAGGGGAVLGALLGLAQAPALRAGGLAPAGWWARSALGWALGLLASALLAEVLPDGPFTSITTLVAMGTGALTGLVVGVVTAPAMKRMLRDARPAS